MRTATVFLIFAACSSNDDDDDTSPNDSDDTPGDTDGGNDTDAGDTDTDVGDTDLPSEDFCAFTQCGGDVVGTWNLIGACLDIPTGWEAVCPTATAEVTVDVTGIFVFDAAGTYTTDGTTAYESVVTIPAECNVGVTDCSDWEGVGLIGGIECTGDVAVACICTTTIPPSPLTNAGTWMYVGEDVEVTSDTGARGTGGPISTLYETCQEADRLQMFVKGLPFKIGFTLER